MDDEEYTDNEEPGIEEPVGDEAGEEEDDETELPEDLDYVDENMFPSSP